MTRSAHSTPRRAWFSLLALLAILTAACGGGTENSGDRDDPGDGAPAAVEAVTVTFDLETPLDTSTLTAEQLAQFEGHQTTVVNGIAATIAAAPHNSDVTASDVIAEPAVLMSDSGDVILVEYIVADVEVDGAFGGTKTNDKHVRALFPLLIEGALAPSGSASATVALAVVFPPNFIPDESEPRSLIQFNDAIGGGSSRTDRPDGQPLRTFDYLDGPKLYWP